MLSGKLFKYANETTLIISNDECIYHKEVNLQASNASAITLNISTQLRWRFYLSTHFSLSLWNNFIILCWRLMEFGLVYDFIYYMSLSIKSPPNRKQFWAQHIGYWPVLQIYFYLAVSDNIQYFKNMIKFMYIIMLFCLNLLLHFKWLLSVFLLFLPYCICYRFILEVVFFFIYCSSQHWIFISQYWIFICACYFPQFQT